MSSKTRKDRIRNKDIRDNLGVTPIERESLLRWFGYKHKSLEHAIVRSDGVQTTSKRKTGRPN